MKNIEYQIKYSKIKNIYIQIKNGQVIIKAPKRVSKKEIEKLIEQKAEWIKKAYKKKSKNNPNKHYITKKNLNK